VGDAGVKGSGGMGLKVNVVGGKRAPGFSGRKTNVRVEVCVGKEEQDKWTVAGETTEENMVVGGMGGSGKVGMNVRVRSRFVLSDGTVGVASDAVAVGGIPKRKGLIVLELPELGGEASGGVAEETVVVGLGAMEEEEAKRKEAASRVVDDAKNSLRDSSVVLDFKLFMDALAGQVGAEGEGGGSEEEEETESEDETEEETEEEADEEAEQEDLAKGWKRVYSEAEGAHYYHHAELGRSCWTKPTA
jgi:hypothetical protein